MDDWTYPYSDPGLDAPSLQRMLLDQVGALVADRLRIDHQKAAMQAEADGRAVDLKQSRVWDSGDAGRNIPDVPLPFEASADTSLNY